MKPLFFLLTFLSVGLISCGDSSSNSQSENHKKTHKADIADIELGIRDYISRTTEENSGFFPLEHDSGAMNLKLVRVHTEYLSNLGPKRYFACVDLADEKGDVYDVDFFLEGVPGKMDVTETTVHKLNGKPFYTWEQQPDKTWERESVEGSGKELLGVVEGSDAFDFNYAVTLPEITGPSEIWIPVATSNAFQDVELTSVESPRALTFSEEEKYGNTVGYLKLNRDDSGAKIALNYRVNRREKRPYEEPGTDPSEYLDGSDLIPVGGRFSSIVEEALDGKQGDSKLMQARAIYDYIIDNMRYRKAGEYGTGDANYACDAKSGNCTEFHSFFISLARTAGIPARFAIGAAIPSERNEGGVNGYHCWAEFYAENKWWPVDISEGNKYTPLATYYFGHHPANRLELSRGRDLLVKPSPASGTIPFFAYPVIEIEGRQTTARTEFSFERKSGSAA
ncbi:MAG: transglutaminase-like domain-containing protein [Cryomorphaceae bacterium]